VARVRVDEGCRGHTGTSQATRLCSLPKNCTCQPPCSASFGALVVSRVVSAENPPQLWPWASIADRAAARRPTLQPQSCRLVAQRLANQLQVLGTIPKLNPSPHLQAMAATPDQLLHVVRKVRLEAQRLSGVSS
jgi:hypothetical protein